MLDCRAILVSARYPASIIRISCPATITHYPDTLSGQLPGSLLNRSDGGPERCRMCLREATWNSVLRTPRMMIETMMRFIRRRKYDLCLYIYICIQIDRYRYRSIDRGIDASSIDDLDASWIFVDLSIYLSIDLIKSTNIDIDLSISIYLISIYLSIFIQDVVTTRMSGHDAKGEQASLLVRLTFFSVRKCDIESIENKGPMNREQSMISISIYRYLSIDRLKGLDIYIYIYRVWCLENDTRSYG